MWWCATKPRSATAASNRSALPIELKLRQTEPAVKRGWPGRKGERGGPEEVGDRQPGRPRTRRLAQGHPSMRDDHRVIATEEEHWVVADEDWFVCVAAAAASQTSGRVALAVWWSAARRSDLLLCRRAASRRRRFCGGQRRGLGVLAVRAGHRGRSGARRVLLLLQSSQLRPALALRLDALALLLLLLQSAEKRAHGLSVHACGGASMTRRSRWHRAAD